MSDWLFDLGNSRFKAAPWHGGTDVGEVLAWPHGADALAAGDTSHGALPRGRRAWVASVAAPALTTQMLDLLRQRFEQVHVARTSAECAGVRIAYAEPARMGVDRFLALLGAHGSGEGGDVLVAGVGTALTIDLLDAQGRHHGGRIAASPTLMRQALHQRAAQLPEAGGRYVEFADDTWDALASGCDGAAVALVERSLAEAAQQLDREPTLLLHGGGAPALLPLLPQARLREALVLEGLAAWARTAGSGLP
ncbi:type III pantothenate kinase [Pseudoxanthomonas suwonensis]|uniref:type III pantothenate kinase n=1 Tax=Pseudoxanthomonas suwonensis TaxID=314722 RepID=UPI000490A898|nr:type III pantothenate kinase [Pseudoxanthomonas suwonensis]